VGFRDFPFHIELKGDKKHIIRPIEFNPRVGGGSIVDLVSAIYSVNLREIALERVLALVKSPRCFVTVVVQPDKKGKIRGYRGIDRIQREPDCVFMKKIIPEGRFINRLDMEIYLIEFCVVARNEAAARKRVREMLRWVTVDIE
jgi:hypothetical protein